MPHTPPAILQTNAPTRPHTQRSLIIAAASARSLARSAAAADYQPLCADCFGDQDLLELLQQCGGKYLGPIAAFSELPQLLAEIPADIPLLWAGGLEHHPELLRQLALARPVLGLPLTAVSRLRQPEKIAAAIAESGSTQVKYPHTLQQQPPPHSGRWLWKPTLSSGGLGVQRLTDELRQTLASQTTRPPGCFQQELAGLTCSILVACDGALTTLVGMSLQFSGWPELNAGGFRFCGNLGPLSIPPRLASALHDTAQLLMSRCGNPRGILGMDLLLTNETCWLLEINPRIPASHWIYESTGAWNAVNFVANPEIPNSSASPCHLLQHPLRVQLIIWSRNELRFPEIPAVPLLTACGIRAADCPAAGTTVPAGTPVCSLLAEQPPGTDIGQLAAAIQRFPASLAADLQIQPAAIAAAVLQQARHWQTLVDAWT